MPNTSLEDVDKAAGALAKAAIEYYGSTLDSLNLDIQDSGEHPYRVFLRDEPVPLGGVALVPEEPAPSPHTSRAEPKQPGRR
jgi:hypothetical protein